MMDIRKLKELVRLMVENDLTELDLRDKEEQATLRRQTTCAPPQIVHRAVPAPAQSAPAHAPAATVAAAPATAPKPADSEAWLIAIESPMVGTFYASPGPDKPPFVSVGATIDSESVVCLIEAMKIFNEIKAEKSGTIAKVLVQSGQAVEFGQKLFLVKPS